MLNYAGIKSPVGGPELKKFDLKKINLKKFDFKKFKKGIIFQTITLLVTLAVLAGIGAGIALIKHRTDHESVATKYFTAYIAGNTETMYEYVDVDESEFINYDQFVLRIAADRASVSISEYTLSDPVKKDGLLIYTFTYENEVTEEEETYDVVLTKYREKWFHIIPEYKVVIDDRILDELMVTVPAGTSLYIDDQLAENVSGDADESDGDGDESGDADESGGGESDSGEDADDDESGQTDVYEISHIFEGEHTFYVESSFGESTLITDVLEDDTSIEITTDDISIKDTDKTQLISDAEDMLSAFYENAMDADATYKTIKSYFPDDTALLKKVKKYFKATQAILYPDSVTGVDSYKIIDLTFGEMEFELKSFEYPSSAKITCEFRYEFTASTDTTVLSSYTEQYTGSCNTKVTFTYEADDENGWVMTGIKFKNSSSID